MCLSRAVWKISWMNNPCEKKVKMVASRGDSKKRKRETAEEAMSESPKKTKVHAQRKFAQGVAFSGPSLTPIKDREKGRPSTNTSPADRMLSAKSAKRPNTEDFLTFLCFRRTSILPPELDFFKAGVCPEAQANACQSTSPESNNMTHPQRLSANKQSMKKAEKNDTKKPGTPAVQALRKKYQEQRLAKHKPTNVTKLAQKVKGKNMMRTRSSAVSDDTAATTCKPVVALKDRKPGLSGLRSGLQRLQTVTKKLKKPMRAKNIRSGLRSGKPVDMKPSLKLDVPVARKQAEIKPKLVKPKRPDRLEGLSDFSSDDNEPLSTKKPKTLPRKDIKKVVKVNHTVRTRSKGEGEVGASMRPTRKTKEAAAIYMEMITKKLVSPEKSGDEDLSSVESFPELPNAKRNEQREIEIRARAAARRITSPTDNKDITKSLRKPEARKNDSKEKNSKEDLNKSRKEETMPKEEKNRKTAKPKEEKETSRQGKDEGGDVFVRPATRSKNQDEKRTPVKQQPKKIMKKPCVLVKKVVLIHKRMATRNSILRLKVQKANKAAKKTIKPEKREVGKKDEREREEVKATKKSEKATQEESITAKKCDKEVVETREEALKRKTVDKLKETKVALVCKDPDGKIDSAKKLDKKDAKPCKAAPKIRRKGAKQDEKLNTDSLNSSKRPTRKCSTIDKIWIDIDGFTSDEDDFIDDKLVTTSRNSKKTETSLGTSVPSGKDNFRRKISEQSSKERQKDMNSINVSRTQKPQENAQVFVIEHLKNVRVNDSDQAESIKKIEITVAKDVLEDGKQSKYDGKLETAAESTVRKQTALTSEGKKAGLILETKTESVEHFESNKNRVNAPQKVAKWKLDKKGLIVDKKEEGVSGKGERETHANTNIDSSVRADNNQTSLVTPDITNATQCKKPVGKNQPEVKCESKIQPAVKSQGKIPVVKSACKNQHEVKSEGKMKPMVKSTDKNQPDVKLEGKTQSEIKLAGKTQLELKSTCKNQPAVKSEGKTHSEMNPFQPEGKPACKTEPAVKPADKIQANVKPAGKSEPEVISANTNQQDVKSTDTNQLEGKLAGRVDAKLKPSPKIQSSVPIGNSKEAIDTVKGTSNVLRHQAVFTSNLAASQASQSSSLLEAAIKCSKEVASDCKLEVLRGAPEKPVPGPTKELGIKSETKSKSVKMESKVLPVLKSDYTKQLVVKVESRKDAVSEVHNKSESNVKPECKTDAINTESPSPKNNVSVKGEDMKVIQINVGAKKKERGEAEDTKEQRFCEEPVKYPVKSGRHNKEQLQKSGPAETESIGSSLLTVDHSKHLQEAAKCETKLPGEEKKDLSDEKQKSIMEIFEGTAKSDIFSQPLKESTAAVQVPKPEKGKKNIADTLLEKMSKVNKGKQDKCAKKVSEDKKEDKRSTKDKGKKGIDAEKNSKRAKRNLRERRAVQKYDADLDEGEDDDNEAEAAPLRRQRPVRQCSTGEKMWIESDSDSMAFYDSSEEDEHFLNQLLIQSMANKEKQEATARKPVKEPSEPSDDSYFSASDEEPLQKIAKGKPAVVKEAIAKSSSIEVVSPVEEKNQKGSTAIQHQQQQPSDNAEPAAIDSDACVTLKIDHILQSLSVDMHSDAPPTPSEPPRTIGTEYEVVSAPLLKYVCTFPTRTAADGVPINTHGLDLLSEVAPFTLGRDVSSKDKMQTERIEKWLKESLNVDSKKSPVYDDVDYKCQQPDSSKRVDVLSACFKPTSATSTASTSSLPVMDQSLPETPKKSISKPELRSPDQMTPKKTLTSVQDLLKLQKERRETPKPSVDNSPHTKNCKCNSCVVKKGWFKNKPIPQGDEPPRVREEHTDKPFQSLARAFNKGPQVKSAKVPPLVHASSQSSQSQCSKPGDKKPIFQQRKLSFLERMKERERKEASCMSNPNAFSPSNESSVYAFEPESVPVSTPFRRKTRDSRTSSTNTSRSDEDALKICEEDVPLVCSGTQVDKKLCSGKALQSASIAVQVNLDTEQTTTVEQSPDTSDGKSIEISTQTEVPEDDSDSHMFYIPLQQNATGVNSASDPPVIQGVALKLGTEGPMGPNQRVIMKAKLVTKSPDTPVMPPGMKAVVMPQPKRIFDQSQKNPPVGTVQPTTRHPPGSPSTEPQTLSHSESSELVSQASTDSGFSLSVGSEPKVSTVSPPSKTLRKLKEEDASPGSSNCKPKRGAKQKTSEQTASCGKSARLVEAPTFHPTEKEFQDPLEFFDRIRPAAEQFGICRIVPPSNFKPDCKVSDDMRFTAYNQYVSRMLNRWGPNIKEMMAIKRYLATQSISLKQPPWIGGIEVDLPRLYQSVQNCGGLMKVMEKKKWAQVADMMRIPRAAQDRVTKLDDIYCKYLLPYDTLSHDERQKLMQEVEKDWQEREKNQNQGQSEDSQDEEEESYIDECDECIVKGRNVALNQFYRVARNTMSMWFKNSEPTPAEVETEFWRHVQERNHHVCVHSGSIDSSGWGYGFPTAKNNAFSKHPWNLKVLTNNSGSVLRSLGPVMGVTVPTLHVGMVFTAFCWYRDPHGLPWIEYLHTGAPKIWYGISDDNSAVFREAVTQLMPNHVKPKPIWLPSDTAMVPPSLLVEQGVSLCQTVQQPGQFILVFPRAFISSVCTGYLVSESVYFTQSNWLSTAEQVFKDIQDSSEPTMFSLEKLLFSIATDSRSSVEVLKQVLPMMWHVRQTELDYRKTLFNLGLKTSERLPARQDGVNKKRGRWAVDEDGDYECEMCRANLFVSLVSNSHEEGVYCLPHAIEMLTTKRHQLKYCKLLFGYTQEEMTEILEKLEQRIESKGQKKLQNKSASLSKTAA